MASLARRTALRLEALEPRLVPSAADDLVGGYFRALLGRQADADGLAAHSAHLERTGDGAAVAADIMGGGEFRARTVAELYSTYLGRSPDGAGATAWTGFLAAGGSLEGLHAGLLASEEYYGRRGRGADAAYVEALYRDLFGRAPDAEGLAAHLVALAATPREAVVAAMLDSPEADDALVRRTYFELLSRPAEATGRQAWAGALQTGLTWNELRAAFLASEEFGAALGRTLDVTTAADSARASAAVIGPGGGVLTAVDARGAVFTLTVPAGAVSEDRAITMAPLAAAELPLTGGMTAAVQFGPDGLSFLLPATLTIDLPAGADASALVGFGYAGAGAEFHLQPHDRRGGRITLQVAHFSGAGVGGAAAADLTLQFAFDPINVARERIAEINRNAVVREGSLELNDQDRAGITEALKAWFDDGIKPGLQSGVPKSFETFEREVSGYVEWLVYAMSPEYNAALGDRVSAGDFVFALNLRDQLHAGFRHVRETEDREPLKRVLRLWATVQQYDVISPTFKRAFGLDNAAFQRLLVDLLKEIAEDDRRALLDGSGGVDQLVKDVRGAVTTRADVQLLGLVDNEDLRQEQKSTAALVGPAIQAEADAIKGQVRAGDLGALQLLNKLLGLVTSIDQFGLDAVGFLDGRTPGGAVEPITPESLIRDLPVAVVIDPQSLEAGADPAGPAKLTLRAGLSVDGRPATFDRPLRLVTRGSHEADSLLGPDGNYTADVPFPDGAETVEVSGVVSLPGVTAVLGGQPVEYVRATFSGLKVEAPVALTAAGVRPDGAPDFVDNPGLQDDQTATVRFRLTRAGKPLAFETVQLTVDGAGFLANGFQADTATTGADGYVYATFRPASGAGASVDKVTAAARGKSAAVTIRVGGVSIFPDAPGPLAEGDPAFQFEAKDPAGKPVSDLTWSVSGADPDGAEIDQSGLFTPKKPGAYTVRIKKGTDHTFLDEARVTVKPAIEITAGEPIEVAPGATAAITFEVNRKNGGTVQWSLLQGGAEMPGAIDAGGNLTAPKKPGSYTVVAQLAGTDFRDEAAVEVFDDLRLDVIPGDGEVEVGGTGLLFTSHRDGGRRDVDWAYDLSRGTITRQGTGSYVFEAAEGHGQVVLTAKATDNEHLTEEVTLTVKSRTVNVTASETRVKVGESVTLSAENGAGDPEPVYWAVDGAPQNGGAATATLDFTPDEAGEFTVVATSAADSSAKDEVKITAEERVFEVLPHSARVRPGESKQFTATLDGEPAGVTWSVTSGGEARPGLISPGGLFTAPEDEEGTFTVTATLEDGTSQSAAAIVTESQLDVSPDGGQVVVGDPPTQFRATLEGEPVEATWEITSGGEYATITADGRLTAVMPGLVAVRARSASDPTVFSSNVVIEVVADVVISPSEVALVTGETQQFTAANRQGEAVEVTWQATGGTIDQTGLFQAPDEPGTYTVKALGPAGAVLATTTVTVGHDFFIFNAPATQPQYTLFTLEAGTRAGDYVGDVTWSVSAGTIDPDDGDFQAPGALGLVTITATLVSNPAVKATATVQIVRGESLSLGDTTLGYNEVEERYPIGGYAIFRAGVRHGGRTFEIPVTWHVSGGDISERGLFRTPLQVAAGPVTLTATSVDLPSLRAVATFDLFHGLFLDTLGEITMFASERQEVRATYDGRSAYQPVTWQLDGVEVPGFDDSKCRFDAPSTPGVHTLTAVSQLDPNVTRSIRLNVLVPPVNFLGTWTGELYDGTGPGAGEMQLGFFSFGPFSYSAVLIQRTENGAADLPASSYGSGGLWRNDNGIRSYYFDDSNGYRSFFRLEGDTITGQNSFIGNDGRTWRRRFFTLTRVADE